MNKVAVFFVGILILTFSACSNSDTSKTEKSDDVQKVMEQTMPEIQSVSQIALKLKAVGAVYLPGIINGIDKVPLYAENNAKSALNMGVYVADLEYNLIYNQLDDAKLSASGISVLGAGLGIETHLDDALKKSFDESLTEEQRVLMIDEGLKNSRLDLRSNSDKNSALLIVTGYYIEQLYQLLQIINNFPEDVENREIMVAKLYEVVKNNDESLGNLIKEISNVSSWSPAYKGFLSDLERLQLAIEGMKSSNELEGLSAKEIINDPNLIDVRRKVLKLRNFVTE
jgi:hypothetical protein